jgi:2-oxo-4-hydroxy-4-carboxy-5-ureidoimidazoline decarboxylase
MPEALRREVPVEWLDGLSREAARAALWRCCASSRWVEGMLARRPFRSSAVVRQAAREVWSTLGRSDYLEAFAGHPPIGASLHALRAKFGATEGWSADEQAGVGGADERTLLALERGNRAYLTRFGYIFIVCANGRSAPTLLALLTARLLNSPERELAVAAAEQAKITELRLEKLRA